MIADPPPPKLWVRVRLLLPANVNVLDTMLMLSEVVALPPEKKISCVLAYRVPVKLKMAPAENVLVKLAGALRSTKKSTLFKDPEVGADRSALARNKMAPYPVVLLAQDPMLQVL